MKGCYPPAVQTGNKRFRALMAGVILTLLAGCDDPAPSQKAAPAAAPVSSASSVSHSNTSKKPDAATLAQLAAKSAGQPLTLLDASELQLDGASALVLTFSVPLEPNQDFSSHVHVVDSVSGTPDGAWELSDNLTELRLRHLQPGRELVLTVDSGIKAANGSLLEEGSHQTLKTRAVEPSVGFASRGSLLPTRLAEGLPVMALNVDKVDVNFFRIKADALPAFLVEWQYGSSLSVWDTENLQKRAELVYTGRFDLTPQPNTRERVLLPLADIAPLKQAGVYLAVMQQAGHYSYSTPATLFTLSDIGVSVHRYHDQLDIFAQGLADGRGLKGTHIQLLDEKGKELQTAVTDGDGHVQLNGPDNARLLLATQDGQTSLIDLSQPALDLAEFDIAGPEGFSKTLFAFGPRDLYRPGETMQVNALLRDADGKAIAAQPIKADLIKPGGNVARSFLWQPQNGLYQYQYPIPDSAPTGEWVLRMNLGDKAVREYAFQVEDFLPERLALDLTGSAEPLEMDSEVSFGVNGRYLYGAPAAGNQLQGELYLRPLREAVASLPGYQFGAITEENLTRTLSDVDQKLDEEGKTNIVPENSWSDVHSPLKVILQASLLESGGRPVTRRADQAIWPAQQLVGIRPQFGTKQVYDYQKDSYSNQAMVDDNSQAAFDVVYTNAAGQKLAANGLKVTLIRERRDYYWQWSEGNGWESLYDKKDLAVAETQIDIAAEATATVSFPVEWGAYRLEVEDPQTGLVSSMRFWAGYSWQDNTDGSDAVRPDQVKLKMDKPAYQPGEKVKLHIEAPAAGKGYLLVESSDGPLWWQQIDVPAGGTEVEVPLNKSWRRHDLYFSATVIRPGDKQQQSTPKRAVGLLHLPLVEENRKLALSIESPARIRPNQTLTVKVKAAGHGATPRTVHMLLSAVDSGILSITDFKTPDPYDAFLGRKRYSVDQYDVYGQLIEAQGRLASLRFGGDGGDEDPLASGGKKPITEVNIVAQQAQPVELDANGEGEVQLAIPDFNGELRLMAQAWSDEDFGSAESKVVVAAPVIAELSAPRFLAGGDTTNLALDLSNLSGETQTLNIGLSGSGLIALTESNPPASVTLKNGQRTTLHIPVRAGEGFGSGEVALSVSGMHLPGEKLEDYHHTWKIGVRPAYPARTQHFASVLHQGESWVLPSKALSGLAARSSEGALLLTSTPPLNLSRWISELMAYPYGCLEQTTSGLFPSLYTSQAQLQTLGIKGQPDDQRRRAVDVGIERLLGMQLDNGGFGLWSNASPEEYWLTAYVTDFLVRAREQGYSVSTSALDKANQRLVRYLQDGSQIDVQYSADAGHTRFAVQAYAALVLARQQQAPLGALRQVYQQRENARSGLPLVQLAIALKLMGDMPRYQSALQEGLQYQRAEKPYWLEDYGSPLRDDALILALLNEYQLAPEQRDQRLIALSESLFGQRWLSTQESNALFLAGRATLNSKEAPWQATVNQDAQPLSSDKALNQHMDAAQLDRGIQVTNTGDSVLYSRFDLVGYSLQAPLPEENVLSIHREYLDMGGNPQSLASLSSGQLLLVHLRVSAKQHVPDALVVDLLPAGLELENQNLAQSSASLGEAAVTVNDLMTSMQQADIKYQEFRDDRYVTALDVSTGSPVDLLYLVRAVTPGSYSVPAPQVESMYKPEWRATGATPDRMNVR